MNIKPNYNNMNIKLLPLFGALLATLFTFLTASAQGEWKWANYWTGNDDPLNSTNPYNYVVRTAFDDDGNVYVFGSFGGNARIYDQNQSSYFCSQVSIIAANTPGTVLAKFDANGNLLWKKVIKSSYDMSNMPYDMYLKDNRVVIAGEYSWDGGSGKQLWFLDTLITQQVALSYPSNEFHPPFTFGKYTYFICFDLNGNKLESHFVKTKSRELYLDQQADFPLGRRMTGAYPICIDSHGNTYIATPTQYGGSDTLPYTIVIDEDSSKIYNLFLPENCTEPGYVVNNIMLYKFTSNWTLDWMKTVIASTEGIASPSPTNTDLPPIFNPFVGGMNIDENDNIYLSGYIQDMFLFDEYNQYPMKFFWDDSHFATVNDHGLAMYLSFIIKYDSNGNVLWSNQTFSDNSQNNNWNNTINWTDNLVKNNSVYLAGRADNLANTNTCYFFDNTNNILPISQNSTFFVRFNKQTGEYESCGVVPGEKSTLDLGSTAKPAVINNHLLMVPRNYTNTSRLLCYFNTDGEFEKADTVSHLHNKFSSRHTLEIDDEGHILFDMTTSEDLTFGHDLSLNFDDHQHSHAVIALRYDPSILEPYPIDSTGVAQYDERLDRVRLYPNPAADRITIESPEDLPVNAVAVTNLAGQLFFIQPVGNVSTEVNVRNLAPGTYIAHINTRAGNTDRKFVVGR